MAFGDNYNDLELLQCAAESYAVSDGKPEVIAACRHTCCSVEDVLEGIPPVRPGSLKPRPAAVSFTERNACLLPYFRYPVNGNDAQGLLHFLRHFLQIFRRFPSGMNTCFTPARWAAISFSGRPPDGHDRAPQGTPLLSWHIPGRPAYR